MQLETAFQNPQLCHSLLDRLNRALDGRSMRFMEVCGTHTVAIFQSGLRSLLPSSVTHLSGPGCPVCVTHDAEVAAFLDLAGRDRVIIATFGDLLRVPGPGGLTLKHAQAQGARVEIVYSPLDALTLAAANPGDTVVFLGIGFETDNLMAVAASSEIALLNAEQSFFKSERRIFEIEDGIPEMKKLNPSKGKTSPAPPRSCGRTRGSVAFLRDRTG